MSWALRRTALARADVLDIWLFIAADNVDAADRLVDRIDTVFRTTADFPHIGQSIDAIAPHHRALTVGSYCLIYAPDDRAQTVTLVRVLHGARDWAALIPDS